LAFESLPSRVLGALSEKWLSEGRSGGRTLVRLTLTFEAATSPHANILSVRAGSFRWPFDSAVASQYG
jgi:hypothetical protein